MPYRLNLGEDVPSALRDAAQSQLDDAVHRLRDRLSEDPVDAVHAARKDLKKARSLRAGATRAYRRGRGAMVPLADGAPSDDDLHTLRKRAKDLWYHARLLEEAWPRMMEAQADEAHEMADLLGDDHDLAVLTDRLGRPDVDTAGEDDVRTLIGRRRSELQAQALVVGRRLYAERPDGYEERLARLLRQAQAVPAS